MRYQLIAIGQLKRSFYSEGSQFFLGRLKHLAKIEIIELKEGKGKNAEQVKEMESQSLLAAASGYLIGMDEKGKSFSSQDWADRITGLEVRGVSTVSILVGGAEGHSEHLKKKVDALWSLSQLTLPHDLARLVLLEQLYRAETIRAGHPYHRE